MTPSTAARAAGLDSALNDADYLRTPDVDVALAVTPQRVEPARRDYPAPTDKQVAFYNRLAAERGVPPIDAFGPGVTRREASDAIDALMALPRADRPAPVAAEDAAVEEGVYEKDGIVYVVKRARQSGNLYAKQIVEIGGERLTEAGTVINAEFEYAPGVIRTLSRDDKMDLDRAKALTIRYGFCVACGRHLKAAQSVEQGIGPVCRGKFA